MTDTSQVRDPAAREFLDRRLADIERIFAPEHVILFGSRATGDARADSDIDLILVSDRFKGVRFPDRMADFLVKIRPDPDVEAFCYTPEEFEEMTGRIGVIADAAREGIWVLGRRRLARRMGGRRMGVAEQVKQWLAEADIDLAAASGLLEDGPHARSAFFSQQAAEKALKALYMFVHRATPPKTHDVGKLAADLCAPDGLKSAAEPMTGDYMASRYPDAAPAVGSAYTRQLAESRLGDARAIVEWVRAQVGSK